MSVNGFTPVQSRIMAVLSDGQAHLKQELFECMENPLNNPDTLWSHISQLRKHLRPKGQDIICEYAQRRICYRHVQLIKSSSEG